MKLDILPRLFDINTVEAFYNAQVMHLGGNMLLDKASCICACFSSGSRDEKIIYLTEDEDETMCRVLLEVETRFVYTGFKVEFVNED